LRAEEPSVEEDALGKSPDLLNHAGSLLPSFSGDSFWSLATELAYKNEDDEKEGGQDTKFDTNVANFAEMTRYRSADLYQFFEVQPNCLMSVVSV